MSGENKGCHAYNMCAFAQRLTAKGEEDRGRRDQQITALEREVAKIVQQQADADAVWERESAAKDAQIALWQQRVSGALVDASCVPVPATDDLEGVERAIRGMGAQIAALREALADANADVKRLHSEKMELWEKVNFPPSDVNKSGGSLLQSLDAMISLWSNRPPPDTPEGKAWIRGCRQGFDWGKQFPNEDGALPQKTETPDSGTEIHEQARHAVASSTEAITREEGTPSGGTEKPSRVEEDNATLRRLLAHAYGISYGDDGELQQNDRRPFIDFRRDSVADIEAAMTERLAQDLKKWALENPDEAAALGVKASPERRG